MAYLSPADALAIYGVTASPAQLATASVVIDGYLKRPEGLLWAPDASGAPCYMAGLQPTSSLALVSALAPGVNVSAAVTGWVSPDLVGEVLIADRAATGSTEALTVTAVAGQTVTFAAVGTAHAAGAKLDAGLLIKEERALPAKRPVMLLSRPPAVRVLSAQGRYGFGRRSQQATGLYDDIGLVATLQQFGPFLWQGIDVSQISLSPTTGELWIPAGLYLATYTDVRVSYVAGFQTAPGPLAAACAKIADTLAQFPELTGGLKTVQAGGTRLERFTDQAMDQHTRDMLAPYAARLWA